MTPRIPFHKASLRQSDIDAVVEVLKSGWLTSGPVAARFEQAVVDYIGARAAVATNSCTAALHVALRATGVGPGDEVIVPTWTFCATANVVEHLGATVRLVDIDSTLNITAEAVTRALTSRTKAVIPVHFAGRPCDIDGIREATRARNIAIIEDGAHAIGASFSGGAKVGSAPSTVAFSFYATKPVTSGEGGMLASNDDDLIERCRSLVLHGLSTHAWSRYQPGGVRDYDVKEPGFKYNLSDLQAALAIGQVDRIDEARRLRAQIATEYARRLSSLSPAIELPSADPGHAWHLFVIRVHADLVQGGREALASSLERAGVGVSVHFRPVHTFTYYRGKYGHTQEGEFPVADAAFSEVLSLPIYPDLSMDDVARVCDVINASVVGSRRTLDRLNQNVVT